MPITILLYSVNYYSCKTVLGPNKCKSSPPEEKLFDFVDKIHLA